MTTTAAAATLPPPLPHRLDISGSQPIPFSRLVKVELRKTYDTRAGFWLLVTIGILVAIAEAIALLVSIFKSGATISWGDFVAVAAFVTSILLPVLGIMVVTSEWGQRTAMVTFSLEPRRPRVIAAKLVVGLLLTLATAAIAIAIGLACNLIYLAAKGNADWTFGWKGVFGFLIAQSLAMIGGFALAALTLNTPAAIVVFFVYKWAIPIIFGIASALLGWFDTASQWFDFQRAQGPLFDLSLDAGEWGHLIVSGLIWLVLPLAIGLRRILNAEVK